MQARIDSLKLKDIHVVKTSRPPTDYIYELMPFVNLQLSARHALARRIDERSHCSLSSDLLRKSKSKSKSKVFKSNLNKNLKAPSQSTQSRDDSTRACTHSSPEPYVKFARSSHVVPIPVQSLFFDSSAFNNIDTRPGHFEAFPHDELTNWTLRLKRFEESRSTPRLQPAESVDKPYTGLIASDDSTQPPRHVQLRANLRYDNGNHKRWNVDRHDFRGRKASIGHCGANLQKTRRRG